MMVKVLRRFRSLERLRNLAVPMSISLVKPCGFYKKIGKEEEERTLSSIMIFSGLMSRWMMLLRCRYSIARIIEPM